ncbi:MAG: 16S rRNA (cytosine(967)-C(5))-methyltransferase RsmB [Erysipelotrichaceae bacterium]|nr:16S rRNA (cytosine(967)-C(5))-methyltransferase RsmB [Erysipelotrichaceae bacterium]MDY5252234.1 16S rRNA (cytosine(967)-C(5))-methyltransferase RsmB [Erysipelotrichaceae bacterium]
MNVRECALNCLQKIFFEDAYANLVLKNELKDMVQNDKNLVTRIVYGTIQNYRLLRYQWEAMVKKLPDKRTCIILDMSTYQLLMMDKLPAYAIINEANKLCKKSYKGLVNAILHKVHKQGLIKANDPAIDYSLEPWLVKLFQAHYEQSEKIFEAFLQEAKVYGRINNLKCEHLPFNFLDETCFVGDNRLLNSDEFAQGMFIIQDYASQQVSKQLDLKPGLKVLDLCSAPGTKAYDMAFRMQDQGSIIACDLYEHRVNLIKERLITLGIHNIEAMVNDATILNPDFIEAFDRVLIDAPCSGLGVLRRKADIKLKIKPENLDEIIALQAKILDIGSQYLKTDGVLVYSTCTLNKKENEKQVAAFLKTHPEFQLVHEEVILPFDHDGFYHAKLVKKAINVLK